MAKECSDVITTDAAIDIRVLGKNAVTIDNTDNAYVFPLPCHSIVCMMKQMMKPANALGCGFI